MESERKGAVSWGRSIRETEEGHARASPSLSKPSIKETLLASPCRGRLGSSALGEASDGCSFRVVDVEDRQQLGDLKHFLELAPQVAQAQRGPLRFRAVMRSDQGAEAGAVDKSDVVHVEDDFLFSVGDQALHFFAQRIALFTQNDAAVQRHHGHAIHFAVRHLQCHVGILLVFVESGSSGNQAGDRTAYQ